MRFSGAVLGAVVVANVLTASAFIENPLTHRKIDTSSDCMECEAMMDVIYKTFTNEDTISSMMEKIEKGCAHLPDKAVETCDRILEALVTIPEKLFEGMEDLAWPIPQATCALARKCTMYCCDEKNVPEQVHLSMGGKDHSIMGVSWVTMDEGKGTYVEYGLSKDSLESHKAGDVSTYTVGNWVGTIHRATMTDLAPGVTYYYRVGDGDALWSKTFSFTTIPVGAEKVTFAIIADMGYAENSDHTVEALEDLVNRGEIDVVVHSGDMGYADGYQPHWDVYFNKIENIVARVPYMVTPGNHEFFANFSAYKHRFFMPGVVDEGSWGGSNDGMYYSWDCGQAHFVALNSETPVDTGNFKDEMLDWAVQDMATINRNATPWLVSHFHRPMYCTNDRDCDFTFAGLLRLEAEKKVSRLSLSLSLSLFLSHSLTHSLTYIYIYIR
jgi:hypothetical protein